MRIGVYSSICEEDAVWIDQYLAEVERLGFPFAVNFDRCSEATKDRLRNHRLCTGWTVQDDPAVEFTEQHKQGAFDLLEMQKFDWALAWDVDETWEREAPAKFATLAEVGVDYYDCPWKNLWDDTAHIRVDGPFSLGHRVKLYRLKQGWRWHFDSPITNGAKHTDPHREPTLGELDLTCLHHGMMTHEMREQHKARWDRIYGTAVGRNPYGFWDHALDQTITPKIITHGYL